MLAYFYDNEFVGMWQDQSSDPNWLDNTHNLLAATRGLIDKDKVEVFLCPPVRSDKSFFFDENKNLVVELMREPVEVDGVSRMVISWDQPLVLEKFYPKESP